LNANGRHPKQKDDGLLAFGKCEVEFDIGVEMEFQQLEMFAALVEEGSVSRAADRVFRTAPAVSIALRKLEVEMGVTLFDRSAHTPQHLTPAGKLLYTHAISILEMRKAATLSIKDLINGRGETLRFGTHESVSLYVLPLLLRHFYEAHTNVTTEMVCGSSERILTTLRGGTIDLAAIADVPDDLGLERHLIVCDELVVITNPKHRSASAKSVGIRDLANEFLLVQGTRSKLRSRIEQALKENNTPYRLGAENIAIEGIKRMVANDLGIGFVPLMCVREEAARRELATIRVDDIPSQWDLWIVRSKDRQLSVAAHDFIQMCLSLRQSPDPLVSSDRSESRRAAAKVTQREGFRFAPGKAIHCS
jgi:DNA-binding transcriptional LysR family regulator